MQMKLNIYECPECGWNGNFTPDQCPSCGCDLKEYRAKIREEMCKEAKVAAERERLEEIEKSYQEAIRLFNEHTYISYQEARTNFMALGDYKCSVEFVEKCKEGIYQASIKEFNINSFLKNIISKEEPFDYFNTPFIQACREKYDANSFKKIKSIFEKHEDYKQSREYMDYCDKAIELFLLYDQQTVDYEKYCKAVKFYNDSKYEKAIKDFKKLNGFLDSQDYIIKCYEALYQQALQSLNSGHYEDAFDRFEKISSHIDIPDPEDFIIQCQEGIYQQALQAFHSDRYENALIKFKKISEYKDVSEYISRTQTEVDRIEQKRQEEHQKEEEARCLAVLEKQKEQRKKNLKERTVHVIVYLCNLVLCIVFGIILFSNKEQISIISSFGWWCVGYIVFAFLSIGTSGSYLHKALTRPLSKDFKDFKKSPVIVVAVMLVFSIIAFAFSAKLEPDFHPTKCITVTATAKEDTISGKYFDSVLTFDLQNTSNVKVTYINGEMVFYNGETKVAAYNVYFQGDYAPGESYQTNVEFSEWENSSLYDVSFENLKITYRVTSAQFNDETEAREYNGETITIKELS